MKWWLIRFMIAGSGFLILAWGFNEFGPINHVWAVYLGITLIYLADGLAE